MHKMDIEQTIHAVVRHAARHLPAAYVFVSEFNDQKQEFRFLATVGFEQSDMALTRDGLDREQRDTIALMTHERLVIDQQSQGLARRVSELLGGVDLCCGASIPIVCGEHSRGVFGAYAKHRPCFDEPMFRLFDATAGNVEKILQHSHDPTDKIIAAKREWEATVDSLPQLVIVLDEQARVARINKAYESWGIGKLTQARGRSLLDIMAPFYACLGQAVDTDWPVMLQRLGHEAVIEWERSAGVPPDRAFRFTLRSVASSRYDKADSALGFSVLIIDDISTLKRAEYQLQRYTANLEGLVKERTEELQKTNEKLEVELLENKLINTLLARSHKRYAGLVKSTLVGVAIVRDGHIDYCNGRFAEIFHAEKKDLSGTDLLELIAPEDREAVLGKFTESEQHMHGFDEPLSVRIEDATQGEVWIDLALSSNNKHIKQGVLVNIVDVTEKKAVENKIRSSEKQLRLLSCQLIDAQELERKRIASELHDGLGQLMGAIKYKLERAISDQQHYSRSHNVGCLKGVVEDLRGLMDEVRKIAMDLRPSSLDDLGVVLTLGWFCREFQRTYADISIVKNISVEESMISNERKLVIYRIVQEAMNNAAKYARAGKIELSLVLEQGRVRLQVEDDGQGFDVGCVPRESCAHGFGLRSMCERAELTGGVFTVQSRPGEGTCVRVEWPEHSAFCPGYSAP